MRPRRAEVLAPRGRRPGGEEKFLVRARQQRGGLPGGDVARGQGGDDFSRGTERAGAGMGQRERVHELQITGKPGEPFARYFDGQKVLAQRAEAAAEKLVNFAAAAPERPRPLAPEPLQGAGGKEAVLRAQFRQRRGQLLFFLQDGVLL